MRIGQRGRRIEMKSMVKKAVAGLVATAALVGAVAAPAEARGYYGGGYGYGYHHYHGGIGRGGAAVLGGIAGLAVGAAIASPHYGYGGGYGPPRGYYGGGGGGYGYGGNGYGVGYYEPCRPNVVFDPYIGEYVRARGCY